MHLGRIRDPVSVGPERSGVLTRQVRTVRTALKVGIEQTVTRSGLADLVGRRHRTRRLVLAYHNVVPRGEGVWGERALHVTESNFQDHLDVLEDAATVMSLRRLLLGPPGGPGGPFVAITFDDGYRGAVLQGATALAQRGLPATFFVSPGLSQEKGFWWDRLAEAAGGAMQKKIRKRCLEEMAGQQARVLQWAGSKGLLGQVGPSHAHPASDQELETLVDRGPFDLGCHTWRHPNLVRLKSNDRQREIGRCSEWIEGVTGAPPEVISYPYGLESEGVQNDVRASGHTRGLRIAGGWLSEEKTANPFALNRLNVPAGLTANGLRMRLAGIGLKP